MPKSVSKSVTKNQTVLVTGASSGIGLEFSRIFAEEGFSLVLVARSEDKLNHLAKELTENFQVHTAVIRSDLSEADGAKKLCDELQRKNIAIDILINNAGYGLYGKFTETDMSQELKMIHLNVIALTELTKRLLPGMVSRGYGKILNVASTAAFQPGPLMAVYYATKAYVLSFSEALSNELAGTGVTVTTFCPGPTESGFQAAAGLEASKLLKRFKVPDSADVARAGYRALMAGKTVFIPGFMNWAMAQSIRFVPRHTATAVVRKLQESVDH